MSQSEIVFEALHDDVRLPSRATEHSAGYDLRVYLRGRSVRIRTVGGEERTAEVPDADTAALTLEAGEVALLPLGFKATLPDGFEAQIRMRSSWAFKFGLSLPNAPGTIDADYPDEWMVMMKAADRRGAEIRHGDRVAQAVLSRFEALPWRPGPVGRRSDRTGGFGSTG